MPPKRPPRTIVQRPLFGFASEEELLTYRAEMEEVRRKRRARSPARATPRKFAAVVSPSPTRSPPRLSPPRRSPLRRPPPSSPTSLPPSSPPLRSPPPRPPPPCLPQVSPRKLVQEPPRAAPRQPIRTPPRSPTPPRLVTLSPPLLRTSTPPSPAGSAISMRSVTASPPAAASLPRQGRFKSFAEALKGPRPATSNSPVPPPRVTSAAPITAPNQSYPPITVERLHDWPKHLSALRSTLGRAPNARPYEKGIRFLPQSPEEFRAVQALLSDLSKVDPTVSWFCFSPPADLPTKMGIRGLPVGTDTQYIVEELRGLGFPVRFVRHIPGKRDRPGCLFYAQLNHLSAEELGRLYGVTELLCMPGVVVEAWKGRDGPAQCHRCQAFGHSSVNCHRQIRCVRCAEEHAAADCPLPRGSPPTCANCRRAHTANDRRCRAFLREARARGLRLNPPVPPKPRANPPPRAPAPPPLGWTWTNSSSAHRLRRLPTLLLREDRRRRRRRGLNHEGSKTDVPVEELEKLKVGETVPEINSEHIEYHRLDAVQSNGELVSRLEQHASADKSGDEKPHVHAQAQIDLPAEGVHKVVVQEGDHVSVIDATVQPTAVSEEPTTKVFHGAARLVQPGSATNNPPNGHTAVRRAFNADITKETKNNVDHYSSYAGVQYSPLDMAEYVFWTGDERGVTNAIEDFLQEGMMTKEEAIAFLQEIKFNIDYLHAHYSQKAAEENMQQEKMRNLLMDQASKDYPYRPSNLQSFPFGNSPDIIRSISGKIWDMSNNLAAIPALPVTSDLRPEPVKRTYDPMLQTNIISTSDYDRDVPSITEEEYEEMMDKLRAADTLYTEYTLEEIIYQLAKMMFSQSLSREPAAARAATQRFMAFLELEAERGQLSRTIEKKVLDVMIAALTDTIGDHPELLQSRDGLGNIPANRIMRQFLDNSSSEPSMSRAILAAYKDELLKGPLLHKMVYPERN